MVLFINNLSVFVLDNLSKFFLAPHKLADILSKKDF